MIHSGRELRFPHDAIRHSSTSAIVAGATEVGLGTVEMEDNIPMTSDVEG